MHRGIKFPPVKELDEALRIALDKTSLKLKAEKIRTYFGVGRVIAYRITSPEDLPHFSRATMDGYAVRAEDTYNATEERPVKLKLGGEVKIGAFEPTSLGPGEAIMIPTGGSLPPGADAVVRYEETVLDQGTVEVLSPVAVGENVIPQGGDVKKGEVLFDRGHRLRPQDIGTLLGVGITNIEVFRKPLVGIITTGEELIPPDIKPKPGQIRDINSYILSLAIEQLGALTKLYGIVPDEREQLLKVTKQAIEECDLLLISGGSSVGVWDLTLEVMEEVGEVLIQGLSISPGKPTIFATSRGKPIIGLPGNPVSAMIVLDKFTVPIIEKLQGAKTQLRRPLLEAELTKNMPSVKGRTEFVRVRIREEKEKEEEEEKEKEKEKIYADPIRASSSQIKSLSSADGLITIPAQSEGVAKGEKVMVEVW